MEESWHAWDWVMSHIRMSHITHTIALALVSVRRRCRGVISCIWVNKSHTGAHMIARNLDLLLAATKESCHTYAWVIFTHMDESCHTHRLVMSHIWTSHVIHSIALTLDLLHESPTMTLRPLDALCMQKCVFVSGCVRVFKFVWMCMYACLRECARERKRVVVPVCLCVCVCLYVYVFVWLCVCVCVCVCVCICVYSCMMFFWLVSV